jgi:hypothetical protein
MESLDKNWFVNGLQDFEYKKYVLLAYLQHIRKKFDEAMLYPFFSDLTEHYQNLADFEKNQNDLKNHFPKRIERLDFKNLSFEYNSTEKNPEEINEIEQIVRYAMPKLAKGLQIGRELHEEVSTEMEIEPVGITPSYFREGYVFIHKDKNYLHIYCYEISIFERSNEIFRGIHLQKVGEDRLSLSNSYPQMKINLVKKQSKLPNPATFLIRSKNFYPYDATFLPVAKRNLLRFISLFERNM